MKGEYGQECNITSCQKPNSAIWYNHFNHKYYCETCANRLNNDEFNKRDYMRILGHEMCTLVVVNNCEIKNTMRENFVESSVRFTSTSINDYLYEKPKSKYHI